MRCREEQVAIADHRFGAAFDGAAIDADAFAKRVAVANDQLDMLAAETQVLRIATDRAERMKDVVAADFRRTGYNRMRMQDASVAELDAVTDDRVRPDLHARAKLRGRRDRGLHVNVRHAHAFGCSGFGSSVFAFGSRSTILHISVASAHRLPSTV